MLCFVVFAGVASFWAVCLGESIQKKGGERGGGKGRGEREKEREGEKALMLSE